MTRQIGFFLFFFFFGQGTLSKFIGLIRSMGNSTARLMRVNIHPDLKIETQAWHDMIL